MKHFFLLCIFSLIVSAAAFGQSNNPVSIYEGQRIKSIKFRFVNLPADSLVAEKIMLEVKKGFRLYPQASYNNFIASYYIGQIELLPFVQTATLYVYPSSESGVELLISVVLTTDQEQMDKRESAFKNIRSLPVIYNSRRLFATMKFNASEMVYANDNAWFGQPQPLNEGNSLAPSPAGEGWTAFIEGFTDLGLYGIYQVVPKINMHIYGGANYMLSFTAGEELYNRRGRIYGGFEDAYVGVIGGQVTSTGHRYLYHLTYGRKQFILGEGWLITSTSQNGGKRAASQISPRQATRYVAQAGFVWDRFYIQGFRFSPDEISEGSSHTTVNGLNLQIGNKDVMLIGATFLQVPKSDHGYLMPDGTLRSRKGLQVFNARIYKNTIPGKGGPFFKAEGGYQRNSEFDMSAWAAYGEFGWNFAKAYGDPSISYRFAYFSGDDPDSKSYNRWDPLFSGGGTERWTMGMNFSKILSTTNLMAHRIQAVFNPLKKVQMVGQMWLFYAARYNNLGDPPSIARLNSSYYGSEYDLTVKYFHSSRWYFNLSAGYALAGSALRNNIAGTKDWFGLSVSARYSF